MKFGNYLKEHMLSPWRLEYIQYDLLKMELKNRQLDHEWNQQDETAFIELFANEKNKVVQFIHNFNHQLVSRIKYSKHLLQNARKNNVDIPPDVRLSQLPSMKDSTSAFLNNLDDALIEILFDIHDFSTFIYLNHLGFEKILKKHKKWVHINQREDHALKYHHDIASLEINHSYLYYKQVSALRYECQHEVYKESQITYNELHQIPLVVPERRCNKYWVHKDHISEVTAILCMYSYIIPKSTSQDISMSNLYFDNDYMSIHGDRIEEKEDFQVIKCKRFGSFSNESVYYFEHEVHNSSYSDDISSKFRCEISTNKMNDFCQGNYSLTSSAEDDEIDEKEAIKKLDLKSTRAVANAVQDGLFSRSLKPILQCNYNRLTFELPDNDGKLIFTLDTDIEFCSQSSAQDFVSRPNENQCMAFPYAVLEVKISKDMKMDDPSLHWVNAFTQRSKLVHEIPKFSKYIQGMSQVFPCQGLKKPSWFDLYEKGISASAEHKGLSRSRSLCPLLNGKKFRSSIPYSNTTSRTSYSSQKYHDSSVRSSHTKCEYTSLSLRVPSVNINLARSAVIIPNKYAKIVLDMNEKTEMHSPAMDNSTKSCSYYPRYSGSVDWESNSNNNSADNLILDQAGYPVIYKDQPQLSFYHNSTKGYDIEKSSVTGTNSNKRKKKIKVKIEPKVFFANERTFLMASVLCLAADGCFEST
ncbi:VTC domain-containing protein [Parasitella parasitica]|nr:VTC domain-containing protein [Parasitella parasitica]